MLLFAKIHMTGWALTWCFNFLFQDDAGVCVSCHLLVYCVFIFLIFDCLYFYWEIRLAADLWSSGISQLSTCCLNTQLMHFGSQRASLQLFLLGVPAYHCHGLILPQLACVCVWWCSGEDVTVLVKIKDFPIVCWNISSCPVWEQETFLAFTGTCRQSDDILCFLLIKVFRGFERLLAGFAFLILLFCTSWKWRRLSHNQ